MNNFWIWLAGIMIGVGVKTAIDSVGESDSKDDFYIFIRSDDFGKSGLVIPDYKVAKELYDKIVAAKKVIYKDIIEFDKDEKALYEKWKKDGSVGKQGYPTLSKESKVQSISIGMGNKEFERKEFY